jgi:predicted transcriptional regulator
MPEVRDKLSIYIPQEKLKDQPIQRLNKLAKSLDRSVNYLVVQAILEFLEREEKKGTGPREKG